MLRRAARLRHHFVQWKWPQQDANVALSNRVPYGMNFGLLRIGCSPFSTKPVTEFRGIYCGIDVVPDETYKVLWKRIEAAHKVHRAVEVVKEWKDEGNQLTEELLCNVTFKLCARTWFKEARVVTNWLKEQGHEPSSEVYKMLRLDILSRGDTPKSHARPFFDELTKKTETGYFVLLRAYTRERAVDDAEKLMEEFKKSKLMTTAQAYTLMMKMYTKENNSSKAVKTFREFEASGLPHDPEMFLTLVSNKDGVFRSIPAVEKTEAALKKITMDRVNRRDILKTYGFLGKTEEVDRIWTEMKTTPNVGPAEALAAISTYDLLGDISKAEEVSDDLEDRMKGVVITDHSVAMLRMYARHGEMDKALFWKDRMELAGSPADFEQAHPLIMAYLDKGDFDDALETFYRYIQKNRNGHPRVLVEECMVKLLEGFAKRQDVAGAEALLDKVPRMHTVPVYHLLIEVYLSSNKVPKTSIKRRMDARSLSTGGRKTRRLLQQLGGITGEASNYEVGEKKRKPNLFQKKRKARKDENHAQQKTSHIIYN